MGRARRAGVAAGVAVAVCAVLLPACLGAQVGEQALVSGAFVEGTGGVLSEGPSRPGEPRRSGAHLGVRAGVGLGRVRPVLDASFGRIGPTESVLPVGGDVTRTWTFLMAGTELVPVSPLPGVAVFLGVGASHVRHEHSLLGHRSSTWTHIAAAGLRLRIRSSDRWGLSLATTVVQDDLFSRIADGPGAGAIHWLIGLGILHH